MQPSPSPRSFVQKKEKEDEFFALTRAIFFLLGPGVFLAVSFWAPGRRPAVLGINVGKSKITALEQAPDDYAASLELLSPLADYAVINVSSPNTPGLRDLQDTAQLRRLVERLRRLPACPPAASLPPRLLPAVYPGCGLGCSRHSGVLTSLWRGYRCAPRVRSIKETNL